jgi:hypothetical protein
MDEKKGVEDERNGMKICVIENSSERVTSN